MNFADIMKLEWNDIKDDRIYYTRSKTKGNFIVKILPPVREIFDYYQANSRGTKYVFPILLRNDLNPNQLENRKSKALKKFNKDLKVIASICNIDKKLSFDSEKSPLPDWALKKEFSTKKALSIVSSIQINTQEIEELKARNITLKEELSKENKIKDLLFEQGTPLENSVTEALQMLGYEAENYDDGVLELDQVINSPEKHRFIGECEGRDSKDINITKFRQLLESLNADFAREEILEKAYGILFGNPQRLIDPELRELDFTEKCKIGAKREKIALVKTTDLFKIIKYLKEQDDEEFKCRRAIFKGLGKIVQFPKIPK
ncbi:MAG: hypothetical protein JJE07_05040 [Flavobacteriaceae bacterium]|nr:hypothetical protein [Flavobacteriaceae bacterium]